MQFTNKKKNKKVVLWHPDYLEFIYIDEMNENYNKLQKLNNKKITKTKYITEQ